MKRLELNNENLNKELIFKIREAGRYLHPRPADKNRQKEILVFLSENGTIPQRELTKCLKIKPPSVSELLRKLEYADLIRRVPNEHDRRNMNIELTNLGLAIAKEYSKNSKEHEQELFIVLTTEEKEELILLLDKLLEYWEEILEPVPPKPGHRPPHEGPEGQPPLPPHGGPHRPPHEEPKGPRPPHELEGDLAIPFDKLDSKPPRRSERPGKESFGLKPEGPEPLAEILELLESIIGTVTGDKSPLTPPDDSLGSAEPTPPEEDPIIPQGDDSVPPVDESIPLEDSELPDEPDLEIDIDETEDEEF